MVDGADGEAGPYALNVSCRPPLETDCSDGLDEDGDGDTDCEDPDCALSDDCLPTGGCDPLETLGCGDSISASNTGAGATDDVDRWCGDPVGHTGREIAWLFVADRTTRATIRLSGLTADLDVVGLLLNPADGGTCDPSLCVFDEPWIRGTDPETISFDAFQGSPYVLAVDGWDGAASSFELEVLCD